MRFSLKELRARKNETQPETASAIGISTQTYCAWEKNLSNVSISKVAALCKHFGVTLDEIQYEQFFLFTNLNIFQVTQPNQTIHERR